MSKKRKPKDTNAPKRPQSSYFLFMNERRGPLKKLYPTKTMTEISKLIAAEWKSLPNKSKYINHGAELKQKHKLKMEEYKKSVHYQQHQQKLGQWKLGLLPRGSTIISQNNNNKNPTMYQSAHNFENHNNNNNQSINHNKQKIQEMLTSMGFELNYIHKAFKEYENKFGHSYNVEDITEIILRIQSEDKIIIDNNDNKLTNHPPFKQELVNLKGDINYKWEDGDCVWAKYLDYPWWPGQIELDNARSRVRRLRNTTLTVKWFGDFGVKTNECKLINVVPWNPDEADIIYTEVDAEDGAEFQQSVDNANTVYLKVCEERGENPIQSALNYAQKKRTNAICNINEKDNDIEQLIEDVRKRKLENDNDDNRPNKRRKISSNSNNEMNKVSIPSHSNSIDTLNNKYVATKELCEATENSQLDSMELMNKYKQENEILMKKNDELQKKLDLLGGESDKFDTLSLDKLNELKLRMLSRIKLIEEAEKQIHDNTYKCIACMDKAKNISFVDGCDHVALCDQCEASSTTKACPLCQKPYKNVRKLNF